MKILETERLILRQLTIEDADRVEELASDYDVARTTLTIPYPYPKGSAKQFITSVLDAENDGRIAIFAIEKRSEPGPIGIINISITQPHQRGELAYWIGKPFWNKGFGSEAAKAMIEYGFKELKLNRLFAASFTNNPGSWRIMEKIGMKSEGVLRQHVLKWGEFVDLTYYGLLKEEYENMNK
ncbi:MAG TPA: GNAT family N-acetyltransferase [Pseudoneobacillus sp.]|nr:GNAT family N-acetyltransferase [Pseudoneobacillus sp.]